MEFKIDNDMKLFYLSNKSWCEVDLFPCFPKSNKNNYFSIRDNKGNELELLKSLDHLDNEDRKIVQQHLDFKSFIFQIIGIHHIEEDFGVRHYSVATSKGPKVFQTSLEDWPEKYIDDSYLVESLHGEKYQFVSLEFGAEKLKPYL